MTAILKNPQNWPEKRLRFVSRINKSRVPTSLEPEDEVSFVPMAAIGEYGGLDLSEAKAIEDVGSGYTPFVDDDVLIAKITPCFENGKGALAEGLKNGAAFGTTELHVVSCGQQILPKFAFYLSICTPFRHLGEASMYGAGGQKRVPESFVKDFRFGVPPIEAQVATLGFLEKKLGEIDDLIAKKQGLLGLLAEKRSALITRAVTKGLEPDAIPIADENLEADAAGAVASIFAPMIAERFGKLQSGWSFRRLKEVADLKSGAGFPIEYQNVLEEEYAFYKVADLGRSEDGVFMPPANHTVSGDTALQLRARIIPAHSVLYAKIGAALLLNKRRINSSPCCIDNNMTAMICNSDLIDFKYAFYWMQTLDFAEYMNPGALPSFSEGYQAHLPILVPPLNVQRDIAAFLDTKLSEIDHSLRLIERAINQLTEYRAAIITKAVTGELEVT